MAYARMDQILLPTPVSWNTAKEYTLKKKLTN